jgi:AcrR family transcriptional regulator
MRKNKKESILEAAAELFFANGIRTTSMDEIAEKAGASKMTVYSYFQSKDGLVKEVLMRYVREQHAAMTEKIAAHADPLEAMIRVLEYRETFIPERFLKECFAQYPELVQEMLVYHDRHIAGEFEALIFAGQRQGRIRRDLSPHVIMLYVQAIKEYLARPDVLNRLTDFRMLGEQFRTLFLYGLAASEARTPDKTSSEGE